MELPPALMPWAPWLELFPREMVTGFGAMLQRLDRAVGPLRVRSETGSGDPDGFDGLIRRGSYERLLLTEWLLAEEIPDEFVRRAAMGEHAFYRVARREPAGSRLSVALFDAGPNQLGSPRLAHLAALIVLARRAQASGAEFRWGVLQNREMPPLTAAEDSMRQLLEARSLREAGPEDLEYWQERLNLDGKSDDFWVVGGARLERMLSNRGVSRLFVSDPLDPEERSVAALVRGPGRPAQEISLPLPEEKLCGRLLRDPFGVMRTAPRKVAGRFAPTSNFLWGQNGAKLIARCASNVLVTYPVPNSPAAGAGRPKMHSAKSETTPILAAGRIHKATVSMQLTSDGQFLLESIGGAAGSLPMGRYPGVSEFVAQSLSGSVDPPLQPCFSGWPDDEGRTTIYVLMANGMLFELTGKHDQRMQPVFRNRAVRALAPVKESSGLICARQQDNFWYLETLFSRRHIEKIFRPYSANAQRAFFGCGGSLESPDFGLPALEVGEGQWLVITDEGDVHLEIDPSEEVVGVIGPRRYGQSPGMVVLEADRRALRIVGRDWTFELPRAGAEIVHASASHTDPYIAYVTEAGEVAIYSMMHEAHLYRLEAGAH